MFAVNPAVVPLAEPLANRLQIALSRRSDAVVEGLLRVEELGDVGIVLFLVKQWQLF